jgi:hypothetical protein
MAANLEQRGAASRSLPVDAHDNSPGPLSRVPELPSLHARVDRVRGFRWVSPPRALGVSAENAPRVDVP